MMETETFYSYAWPISMIDQVIEILAKKAKYIPKNVSLPHGLEEIGIRDEAVLNNHIQKISNFLGIEAEQIEFKYANIDNALRGACPAILLLPSKDKDQSFLVMLKGKKNYVTIITPENKLKQISLSKISEWMAYALDAPVAESVFESLIRLGVDDDNLKNCQEKFLKKQLCERRIGGCWMIRLLPSVSMWTQLRSAKIMKHTVKILLFTTGIQIMTLLGWWLIGRGSLSGQLDNVWIYASGLVMFSTIPLELIVYWSNSMMMLSAGEVFKNRMLYGILNFEPDEIKHKGAGQFFGSVMESTTIEMFATGGGSIAISSNLELITAMVVLGLGIGGFLHSFAFMCWIMFTILLYIRMFKKRNDKIGLYREMSNDLIEQMVGHRTRLVQEDMKSWHVEEDNVLSRYYQITEELDDVVAKIFSIIPYGWTVIGFLVIANYIIFPPESTPLLAVSIGGIILGYQALTNNVDNISYIRDVFVFWKQVKPVLDAATRKNNENLKDIVQTSDFKSYFPKTNQVIFSAHDVNFRYAENRRMILKKCSIKIKKGDRLLLEGPSGGGKSTFATLVAGIKKPVSGILLLGGFDQQTLGIDEWRKKVVIAPQFHENHVFTGTLAFNLLMGRNWPASEKDLQEAEKICCELGLGELIEKMPARLHQSVGEGGWRLSNGERSRIYIARALLQNAEIVILDESFGALDPENLFLAMKCVLNRASTILVIAHP